MIQHKRLFPVVGHLFIYLFWAGKKSSNDAQFKDINTSLILLTSLLDPLRIRVAQPQSLAC